jgi:hypothetical protein
MAELPNDRRRRIGLKIAHFVFWCGEKHENFGVVPPDRARLESLNRPKPNIFARARISSSPPLLVINFRTHFTIYSYLSLSFLQPASLVRPRSRRLKDQEGLELRLVAFSSVHSDDRLSILWLSIRTGAFSITTTHQSRRTS